MMAYISSFSLEYENSKARFPKLMTFTQKIAVTRTLIPDTDNDFMIFFQTISKDCTNNLWRMTSHGNVCHKITAYKRKVIKQRIAKSI